MKTFCLIPFLLAASVSFAEVPDNSELVIANALVEMNKLVDYFVYANNRKKIRTEFEFGPASVGMICANMGVLDDNYSILLLRGETEMDRTSQADVDLFNSLREDKIEMNLIGDSFCDFNEKGHVVPALVPDATTIVKLVRLRNRLRAATQQHFTHGDTYRPGVRNSAQRTLDTLTMIRGFITEKDGTRLSSLRARDSFAKMCYVVGLNATHTSIVGSAMKYEYEDAKVTSSGCQQRLDTAIDYSNQLLYDFCFRHDHGVGISTGVVSEGLFNLLDKADANMTVMRNSCSAY